MLWLWLSLGLAVGVIALGALVLLAYSYQVKRRFLPHVVRIFQEKPLFIIPRGQPVEDAEDVQLTSPDGLRLHGCYLRATTAGRKWPRR